jgi:hypothetical protein
VPSRQSAYFVGLLSDSLKLRRTRRVSRPITEYLISKNSIIF